jgi:PEGA domain
VYVMNNIFKFGTTKWAWCGLSCTTWLLICSATSIVRADNATDARVAFDVGTAASREERWADALTAFERAHAAKPHPLTAFNIGVCLRATGNLIEAERRFREALAAESELPATWVQDARNYLQEIPARVAQLDLQVEPTDAVVSVDGREMRAADITIAVSGLRAGRVLLRLNPGNRVILVRKDGFESAVLTLALAPGARMDRHVDLSAQNARLRLMSAPAHAIARVDGIDVGPAPVDIERVPGVHRVLLQLPGYDAYETTVMLAPGMRSELRAKLNPHRAAVTSRWWFWTAVGTVVAAAAVTTYFVTRSPEPLDGGGLNWVAGR